ncbi:MFS transporter [Puerhibacterium puerhi]|uniref:MFS transporter n=1 Tax=Puerhibacterium puerhi TaxID=2692623 RepID=UPI001F3B7C7A|nr:MFS transporter [Puerhibacterium puerhi]
MTTPGTRARGAGFLLVALMLVALNLRAPLTSLPPVVAQVSDALALTPAQAGLLTSVPVLCFALLTPPSSLLVARLGPERSVLLAVVGVLAGEILRSAGSVPAALAGTAVLGAGITVGNVAVPVVIARDFLARSAVVTGMYSATMNLGSTLTTTLTVPLAATLGWQWALAGWGVLAVVAIVAWGAAIRGLPHGGAPRVAAPSAAGAPVQTSRRLVVLLCVAFSGQAFSYYGATAWLPEILHSRLGLEPAAAGNLSAPFQLAAIAGSFAVPLALGRGASFRASALGTTLAWLALPAGMLLAPGLAVVWVSIAGAAQGANFTLVFTLITQRAPTVAAARRASAVVQTVGYACAALAPTLLGAVHTATGGWDVPLLVVLATLLVMGVMLQLATHQPRAGR